MIKRENIFLSHPIYNTIENYINNEYINETRTVRKSIIEKTATLLFYLIHKMDDDNISDIHKGILRTYETKITKNENGKKIIKRLYYTTFIKILENLKLVESDNHYITKIIIKNPILTDYFFVSDGKYKDNMNNEYFYDKRENILTRQPKNINYKINIENYFSYTFEEKLKGLNPNEKLLFNNKELKTKDEWLDEFSNDPNIQQQIKTTYELKYDIDEVKDYLISRKNEKDHKGRIINNAMILRYLYKAETFNKRRYTFIITKEGRLYSPITQQPKIIRHFLKYNNEYLYDMDIKNSQPLLLVSYIKNPKYKKDVEEGVFYDNILKYINDKRENNKTKRGREPITRDIIKERIYSNILFSETIYEQSQLYRAMIEVYGTYDNKNIMDEIKEVKQKENAQLWSILQKKESEIFIEKLYDYLSDHNIKYITIHDSILLMKKDVLKTRDILMKIYSDINIQPSINIEYRNEKITL